jgi:hypothetical protein
VEGARFAKVGIVSVLTLVVATTFSGCSGPDGAVEKAGEYLSALRDQDFGSAISMISLSDLPTDISLDHLEETDYAGSWDYTLGETRGIGDGQVAVSYTISSPIGEADGEFTLSRKDKEWVINNPALVMSPGIRNFQFIDIAGSVLRTKSILVFPGPYSFFGIESPYYVIEPVERVVTTHSYSNNDAVLPNEPILNVFTEIEFTDALATDAVSRYESWLIDCISTWEADRFCPFLIAASSGDSGSDPNLLSGRYGSITEYEVEFSLEIEPLVEFNAHKDTASIVVVENGTLSFTAVHLDGTVVEGACLVRDDFAIVFTSPHDFEFAWKDSLALIACEED